jgi:hypothetical protein
MTNAKTHRRGDATGVGRVVLNAPRRAGGPRKLNPERMRSLSPGLRGTSCPECATGGCVNPERVASFVPPAPAAWFGPRKRGHTAHSKGFAHSSAGPAGAKRLECGVSRRFGVDVVNGSVGLLTAASHSNRCRRAIQPLQGWRLLSVRFPRVARASQPWAERYNPFGIVASSVSRMSKHCVFAPWRLCVESHRGLRASDFPSCQAS